jgi:hypothetical protein
VTAEGVSATRVSPDGKFVTVVAGGKLNLFPIAGGEPKTVDIQPGESVLRWSADGRYLFLRQMVGLSAVKIIRLDLANRHEEQWKELRPDDPVGVQIYDVVVTPDGSSYAYSFQRDIGTLFLASGLK